MSSHQVAGYKAAINNPRVTEEGKEGAAARLKELEQTEDPYRTDLKPKNKGNVIGGYKAALKNPNVSEEAKDRAEQVLEEHGVEISE